MPRLSPFTTDFTLPQLFTDETQKAAQNRIFHLITLVLPDPEPPFRIVDSNYNITFGGVAYSRFPVGFSGAGASDDGAIAKATITIANVSRDIMYYVEEYNGLRNCRVTIKTVFQNALDYIYTPQADGSVTSVVNPTANSLAYLDDEYLVDVYTATEQSVIFQLDPIIDLEIRVPRRRYMQDSCYWAYGDPETCGVNRITYPTLCNKTLADCAARNNSRRFGGFPGVNASRRVYL